MLIIYGVYRWKPKRLAFRNDFCLACGEARRSEQVRTFNVEHIFWIPILPLGFWKRWLCTMCGREPHASTKTRRSFKWAGLIVLLMFSIFFWIGQVPPDFVAGAWIFRIGGPAVAVLVLKHLMQTRKDPTLKEKLANILPASDTVCPFCGTALLMLGSRTSCPVCGVVRN